MYCPNCSKTVIEGSWFCMHCGFQLTSSGVGEKTRIETTEATVIESMEDFSEKTRVMTQEPLPGKPMKAVRPQPQKTRFFAWLVGLDGPDKGKDYRVTKEKTTIGKAEDSDLVIQNDFISRNHAVLFYENKKFILNDLQSTNHTFVNDKKISRRVLKDDDVIKFGGTTYKFKCL